MLKWKFAVLACVACSLFFAPSLSAAGKPSGQGSQASPFVLPIARRDSLLNGLQLLVIEQSGAGSVKLHLRVNSGSLFDLAGKGGLADLTAGMLLRGGGGLTAKNVSDTVEQLGLSVRVTVGWDSTDIVIGGPSNDLESMFDLLSRLIVTPTFDQKELDALKAQRINAVKEEAADKNESLRRKALEAVYGSHPYGRPLAGTADSLTQISRTDILNYYSRFYIANNAQLLVEGDTAAEQVTRLARARLGAWKKGDVVPPNFRRTEPVAGSRVLLLDRAEASDGHAVLALMGVSRRAADYFAGLMAVDIFNQLLAQANLGATARLEARVLAGPLTVEVNAPAERLIENVKNVTNLMARLQTAPPALEQVEAAKSRLLAAMAERLRNNATHGDVLLDIETYGLGRDYLLHYADRVNAVTPADIQAAARTYLKPDSLIIAISGPAAKLEADAKRLGTVMVIR
ncbi:MAG TPA: pitrilysin family protein [Blastocatellia bacterium]|nr:pitrilysin family protein [Blastocatellia bacterium]